MADFSLPRREGVTISDLPPAVHVLIKKTLPKNNIVVGSDLPQLRFLENFLKTKRKTVERVTDDMLAGYDGLLYHVTMLHKVDLSPELRQRTGIWGAEPIVKGSAAINTIVKVAAGVIGMPEKNLKRETLDRVGDALTKRTIVDVNALICKGVWILSADLPPKANWKDPWETPTGWLTIDMHPAKRLNKLYDKLTGYVYLTLNGPEAATKYGVSPSQQQHFKQINLDLTRVYRSIAAIAKWKQSRSEPYACALEIASIWS